LPDQGFGVVFDSQSALVATARPGIQAQQLYRPDQEQIKQVRELDILMRTSLLATAAVAALCLGTPSVMMA
jgi:hypothetical protein